MNNSDAGFELPRQILVSVDGSDRSLRAAKAAIAISKKFGAKLIIVEVIETPGTLTDVEFATSKTVETVLLSYMEEMRKKAKGFCDGIASMASKEGVETEIQILDEKSSVVGTIVDYAQEDQADLIVTGSRGMGTFKKVVLGSISDGIVTHAHCSVLVIR